jgi:hypothetical protein
MSNSNLFDLENTDDLALELKKMLKPFSFNATLREMIIALFKIKDTLSIDEVMVGLYRNNKQIKSRVAVGMCLYKLKKEKIVRIAGHGVYKLIKNDDEI